MRGVLGGGEALAEQRDVLVVPRVAVGDGRAVAHPVDLVAVVPPRHHTRVLGRVVAQPPVGLAEVVDQHGASGTVSPAQHDLRQGHARPCERRREGEGEGEGSREGEARAAESAAEGSREGSRGQSRAGQAPAARRAAVQSPSSAAQIGAR